MNTWTRWFQLYQSSVSTCSGELETHMHIHVAELPWWQSISVPLSVFPTSVRCPSSYVERVLLMAEEAVEMMQKQFVCQQLLSIFSVMDLSDEVGK